MHVGLQLQQHTVLPHITDLSWWKTVLALIYMFVEIVPTKNVTHYIFRNVYSLMIRVLHS